jgi:hypothetical protein
VIPDLPSGNKNIKNIINYANVFIMSHLKTLKNDKFSQLKSTCTCIVTITNCRTLKITSFKWPPKAKNFRSKFRENRLISSQTEMGKHRGHDHLTSRFRFKKGEQTKNSVPTAQDDRVSKIKTTWLVLFRNTIGVYCENNRKHKVLKKIRYF